MHQPMNPKLGEYMMAQITKLDFFLLLTVCEGMNMKVLSFGAKNPGGTVIF
jgi:hypothetical protein